MFYTPKMISYIQGKIIDLDTNEVVVLTSGGVGYGIQIHEGVYSQLISSEETELFICHHRTENSESLFGFLEKEEKQVFMELIKISGVGGKVAMQILSLGTQKLLQAVVSGDNKTIESVKGIGKKMAEKIILELKDKDLPVVSNNSLHSQSQHSSLESSLSESIKNTLINMGYNPKEVEKVLTHVPEDLKEAGDILPYCIRELS